MELSWPIKRLLISLWLTLLFLCLGCDEFDGKIIESPSTSGLILYDPIPADNGDQFANYSIRSRWQKENLTYYFYNYTPDIDQNTQRGIFEDALDTWASVSNLSFTEVNNASLADLIIGFGFGQHCEVYTGSNLSCANNNFDDSGDPFTGRNLLAHGYFPAISQYEGDLHFDEFETWSTQINNFETNLFGVAVHELGHSLGLDHSGDPNAIMYDTYNPQNPTVQLNGDDIAAIQQLYGSNGSDGIPPPPPPPDELPPNSNLTCEFVSQYDLDGDGLDDFSETFIVGTDPHNCDTDSDGLTDYEVVYGLNPLNPDTDGDGVSDGQEVQQGSNPFVPDQGTGGSSISGEYLGSDNFGSPIYVQVDNFGNASGFFRILYFGQVVDIPLIGGVDVNGMLVLISYDYYFAFYGTFVSGGVGGQFETAGGGFGTWSATKISGGRIEITKNNLVSSDVYQPVRGLKRKPTLAVHKRIDWRNEN